MSFLNDIYALSEYLPSRASIVAVTLSAFAWTGKAQDDPWWPPVYPEETELCQNAIVVNGTAASVGVTYDTTLLKDCICDGVDGLIMPENCGGALVPVDTVITDGAFIRLLDKDGDSAYLWTNATAVLRCLSETMSSVATDCDAAAEQEKEQTLMTALKVTGIILGVMVVAAGCWALYRKRGQICPRFDYAEVDQGGNMGQVATPTRSVMEESESGDERAVELTGARVAH